MSQHISDVRPSGAEANSSEKSLESSGAPKSPGRRRFIKGLGAAAAAAGVLGPTVAASSAAFKKNTAIKNVPVPFCFPLAGQFGISRDKVRAILDKVDKRRHQLLVAELRKQGLTEDEID